MIQQKKSLDKNPTSIVKGNLQKTTNSAIIKNLVITFILRKAYPSLYKAGTSVTRNTSCSLRKPFKSLLRLLEILIYKLLKH
jgi:hypothetical protein